MTEQNLKQLLYLLYEYYKEQSKTCDHDCHNCELGVLKGYGYGDSCSIEIVEEQVSMDLYRMKMMKF